MKWKSNCKQLNKYVESHLNDNLSKEFIYASLMLSPGERSEDKVLGVPWDTDSNESIIS